MRHALLRLIPPLARRVAIAVVVCAVAVESLRAQSFDDLLRTGRAQTDSGRDDAAVKTLERAIKLNPSSAEAHFQLGRALGSVAGRANVLRQPGLARRVKGAFEKAVELDPRHIGGREGLVQYYLRAPSLMGGSVAKAREQAQGIKQINALRGYFADAAIAADQKDSAGIEKAYHAAATEFPDSLSAVTNYVNILTSRGRGEAAFAPLEAYVKRHPADRAAQYWIGRTAAVTGKQLERGEQLLRGLLVAPPDTGPRIPLENIHYRLGDIAAKRGDKGAARAAYTEALRLNPRMEAAKLAMARL